MAMYYRQFEEYPDRAIFRIERYFYGVCYTESMRQAGLESVLSKRFVFDVIYAGLHRITLHTTITVAF